MENLFSFFFWKMPGLGHSRVKDSGKSDFWWRAGRDFPHKFSLFMDFFSASVFTKFLNLLKWKIIFLFEERWFPGIREIGVWNGLILNFRLSKGDS